MYPPKSAAEVAMQDLPDRMEDMLSLTAEILPFFL
jgi:hypothetical protein